MRHVPFAVLVCLFAAAGGCSVNTARVETTSWGVVDGDTVRRYTLRNEQGMEVDLSDYGAMVTSVRVPDRNGRNVDVVLGFDTAEEYPEKSHYFGCSVGRVGNRIAGGTFELDGETYELARNNAPNHLHGGDRGFDKHVWDATEIFTTKGPGIRFTRTSPDGEEGYPGTLAAEVVYLLTEKNELIVEMTATADAATPCNLVHHTYWNLGGHDSGNILDHLLVVGARRYTPVDETMIPTGELAAVEGTALDFRVAKPIGRDIGAFPATDDGPGGFDHNFCLDGDPGEFRDVVMLGDPGTGITMTIASDQPGLQFYTGNFLDGMVGKSGAIYERNDGVCLETQAWPDAINHQGEPEWPDVVLQPDGTYRHIMVHRFTTR